MDFIYKDLLMDHYRNPRNRKTLSECTFSSGQYNPSCGDRVKLQVQLYGERIQEIAFEGSGCVISIASASLLTQALANTPFADVDRLDAAFIQQLIGIQLGIGRLKCALLPLMALQEGAALYRHNLKGQPLC
jgi:nitrogen fixation NifU-like protein